MQEKLLKLKCKFFKKKIVWHCSPISQFKFSSHFESKMLLTSPSLGNLMRLNACNQTKRHKIGRKHHLVWYCQNANTQEKENSVQKLTALHTCILCPYVYGRDECVSITNAMISVLYGVFVYCCLLTDISMMNVANFFYYTTNNAIV